MSEPAGTIHFAFCEEPAEASLDRAGRWSCTVAELAEFLNAAFGPRWHSGSPADGSPSLAALHAAHAHLGGELEIAPSTEAPGAVY